MNYLLDTCVISELVKKRPNRRVAKWVRDQDEENLFLSVITIGEIQKGIFKLPDAEKRKEQLQKWLHSELRERFVGRILDITLETAFVWGQVLGEGEKRGIILPAIDSLIAAQGISRQMTVVTRNTADMEPSGALLFNPWIA